MPSDIEPSSLLHKMISLNLQALSEEKLPQYLAFFYLLDLKPCDYSIIQGKRQV